MKERPILFSAPMVVALRSDRKTQTRRTRGLDNINEAPDDWKKLGFVEGRDRWWFTNSNLNGTDGSIEIRCPYGVPGDRLYTRESYRVLADYDFRKPRELTGDWIEVWYEADSDAPAGIGKLRPGIFMPRWASRDTLEVVSVRPERLQSITEEDAKAEGITDDRARIGSRCNEIGSTHNELCRSCGGSRNSHIGQAHGCFGRTTMYDPTSFRGGFSILWESINGPDSWAKNPWVWRIEYRRLSATQEPGESAGPLSGQEGR